MFELIKYITILRRTVKEVGKDVPHIKRSHQSDHILSVLGKFEFGDFGRVEIRRIVFLWNTHYSVTLLHYSEKGHI